MGLILELDYLEIKQMKKILVICPSYKRPVLAKRMYDSFTETSSFADMIFALDTDDPLLSEYMDLRSLEIGTKSTVTQRINQIFNQYPTYDYFMVINDDFVFRTQDWDIRFIETLDETPGIVYGNDLFQQGNLPTAFCVSREIVLALGWLQYPKLIQFYGDMIWKILGISTACLYYLNDVIIEHCHYLAGKEQEEIYDLENKNPIRLIDKQTFGQWMGYGSLKDTNTVNDVLNKNQCQI